MRHRDTHLDAVDAALLASEIYKPEGVRLWLESPNPNLNNATPLQFIRAGDAERVLQLLDALASGAYV